MERKTNSNTDIFSKSIKIGRRTYFFDIRETKEGDYYLTVAESKKIIDQNDKVKYIKHKIYLYKEALEEFQDTLNEVIDFIYDSKGRDVISEKNEYYQQRKKEFEHKKRNQLSDTNQFEEVSFDEI